MTALVRSIPSPEEVIVTVRSHQDITEAFRMMKERLGLTNEFCDDVGGLTKGHTDKILGPSSTRTWGPTTFDLFCEMFAMQFEVKIDMAALKRMEKVWENRAPRWFPNAKVGRMSQKLLDRAKPLLFKENGRNGGIKRATRLPAKRVIEIARKGAKSLNRKLTKEQRRENARKAGLASAEKRRKCIAAVPECVV